MRSVEVWRVGGLQGVGWRGVGRAAGQQSGSSLVAERVFFDRAVGWSGVCAGALLLLPAARMFVLWRVVSNTNSDFCAFALLSRCYTINICSSYRLYNAKNCQKKIPKGMGTNMSAAYWGHVVCSWFQFWCLCDHMSIAFGPSCESLGNHVVFEVLRRSKGFLCGRFGVLWGALGALGGQVGSTWGTLGCLWWATASSAADKIKSLTSH